MPPRVTICIPSRNTRPFLEERRDSILRQTFTDWNVVIVDDGSTDGSWQFFEEWAANDARVSLHQGPGQGLYAGWNDAIRRAEGEYVHIATSDDSMDPFFLQTMVAALDAHRDCWMAQCELVIIDEHGRPTDDLWQHVWRNFCPDLVGQFVIRRAPYDGILHYGLRTVYTSINQLLLRREAFSKAGVFRTDLGPTGDFEWGMRARVSLGHPACATPARRLEASSQSGHGRHGHCRCAASVTSHDPPGISHRANIWRAGTFATHPASHGKHLPLPDPPRRILSCARPEGETRLRLCGAAARKPHAATLEDSPSSTIWPASG